MTRQNAKDLTLTVAALHQMMREQGAAYVQAHVNKMLGDLFTCSKQRFEECYQAGFKAGMEACMKASTEPLRPHPPLNQRAEGPWDAHAHGPPGEPGQPGIVCVRCLQVPCICLGPVGAMGPAGIQGDPGPPGPPGQPAANFEIG